jgi:hypothetical protein
MLPAPQNVRLSPGHVTGQMIARRERTRSALTYQWRCAPAATPTVWTQADPVSKASFIVSGLTAGMVYIVQARVVGTGGPSSWSDSATSMSM